MYKSSDPKIWLGIERDKLIRKARFWLPLLGAVLIAYGTPENIFQKFPFLEQVTKVVSYLVPSIDTWSERSLFPSMTRLLFAYLWMIMPIWIWANINHKEYWQTSNSMGNRRTKLLRLSIGLAGFCLMLVIFFSVYYMLPLPAEHECKRLCVYESRFFQFFYASLMTASISYLVSAVFVLSAKLTR
jgi:hypothetical protein